MLCFFALRRTGGSGAFPLVPVVVGIFGVLLEAPQGLGAFSWQGGGRGASCEWCFGGVLRASEAVSEAPLGVSWGVCCQVLLLGNPRGARSVSWGFLFWIPEGFGTRGELGYLGFLCFSRTSWGLLGISVACGANSQPAQPPRSPSSPSPPAAHQSPRQSEQSATLRLAPLSSSPA